MNVPNIGVWLSVYSVHAALKSFYNDIFVHITDVDLLKSTSLTAVNSLVGEVAARGSAPLVCLFVVTIPFFHFQTQSDCPALFNE